VLAATAGIGYEAKVIDRADRDLKDALGPLAYLVSGTSSKHSKKDRGRNWFRRTVHSSYHLFAEV
jgi:hypothetical protein